MFLDTTNGHSPSKPRMHHRGTEVAHRHLNKRRARPHRQFRDGKRAAANRALTAAALYLGKPIPLPPSLKAAAEACGTNAAYVKAAAVLHESEDAHLINRVMTGKVGLLRASVIVKKRAALIAAYRKASVGDKAALGEAVGPTDVWDCVVNPQL